MKRTAPQNPHRGNDFRDFLTAEGILIGLFAFHAYPIVSDQFPSRSQPGVATSLLPLPDTRLRP
jgi:hypothetical protein